MCARTALSFPCMTTLPSVCRSSARETIGRVAAGAIAEHWLRHKWGVEIVAFVSSVGAVSMTSSTRCTCCPPATAAAAAGGGACDATLASPWSRAEIDTRGTLRIVRNCSYWKPHHANSDDQKAADDAAEARFCSDGGSATEPAYVAWDGTVLTRTGAVIAQTASGGGASGGASSGGGAGAGAGAGAREVAASTAASAGSTTVPKGWAVSGEVVCVRCPCPQAAARMATLYRTVKHDKDSIGAVQPLVTNYPYPGCSWATLSHSMLRSPHAHRWRPDMCLPQRPCRPGRALL